MSLEFTQSATAPHSQTLSSWRRLALFGRWAVKTGLPINKIRFWIVAALIAAAALVGVYVDPAWMGWSAAVLVIVGTIGCLAFEYLQQILLYIIRDDAAYRAEISNRLTAMDAQIKQVGHLQVAQSEVTERAQTASSKADAAAREIVEAKQSIYYLVAATDELRRIYNASIDPDSA